MHFGLVILRDHVTNWKYLRITVRKATKLDKMATNPEGLFSIVLLYLLVMWSYKITWQTKNIPTTTVPMPTKLDRIVASLKGLLPIMLFYPLIMWSCEISWQTENIFTTTVSMTTKLGRVVASLEGLFPIMLHYLLVTWSCETLWQTKIIIYSLPQCLWLPNSAGWEYTLRSFVP